MSGVPITASKSQLLTVALTDTTVRAFMSCANYGYLPECDLLRALAIQLAAEKKDLFDRLFEAISLLPQKPMLVPV